MPLTEFQALFDACCAEGHYPDANSSCFICSAMAEAVETFPELEAD